MQERVPALTPGPVRPTGSAARVAVPLLIIAIVVADALTPAGIVVGILLAVPVLLSSMSDRPRYVILASLTALVGFLLAALIGHGPLTPRPVWLANRLFVIITIGASCPLALRLQRQRLQAEAARRTAEASRDLSRLLHSLMAHDLRAPLSVAVQAVELARDPAASADASLLIDAEAGLRRSLESVDRVLSATRAALQDRTNGRRKRAPADVPLAAQIRGIAGAFHESARRRGQELLLQLDGSANERVALDLAVLEHALTVLLDNAVRYADPGPICVTAGLRAGDLRVSVADPGPGYSRSRACPDRTRGAGLGLELARLLLVNAGGSLTLERDEPSGSDFVARLPILARRS